jgi:NAD(P)-dependent dehydrogenase (short-subunit alcohol dehydrogenase family)
MPGGTSGFGEIAAARPARSGDIRLIVGTRRSAPVGESVPLDLTALDSVRSFAAVVRERLGDAPVHAPVLNAGVIRPDAMGRKP